ncbi:MAG: hypothetical protein VCB99_06895 [Myxococcota bacterium]
MSVHGEFRRVLGDAAAALRVARAPDLAGELERACDSEAAGLSAAAEEVLSLLASTRSTEEVEELARLCRVILGR